MSQTILEFKTQLEREFNRHSHYSITKRVLNCLLYIGSHLDLIAATINDPKASRTLRDDHGMAFHIAFAKTPDEVETTITALIEQVKYCIRYLGSLDEPLFIAAFISNIRDSDAGCMEARLRQALDFCVFLESNGNRFDLDSLFQQFYQSHTQQDSSSDLVTCQKAFEFFESYVTYQIPVAINGSLQPLHWEHIKDYLHDIMCVDITAWNQIKPIDELIAVPDKHSYKLYFSTEEEANSWLAFVRSVLPEQMQKELENARVIPERRNGYRFRLMAHQYDALLDEITKPMLEAGPAAVPPVEIIEINEPLKGARLIKSLRWDADTFLTQFLIGCTRSEEQQHPIDLRKSPKKPWVVYPEGVFERPNKPERFRETEEDKTFSPYQSTSLVTDKVQSPVFGHGKTREKHLVGIVMPLEHTKPGSGMVYDGGTIGRPFDFATRAAAEAYWRRKTDLNNPILFAHLADLEAELEKPQHREHYNEVLAKLRWSSDGSCQIGIFSDTLEARLVAQWYAKKLRDHLRAQAKENGVPWNVNYQVPICIYLPGKNIYFKDYSIEEQQADIAAAMQIFDNRNEFNKKVAQNDYEFLLAPLLEGEEVGPICEREIKGTPLLYHLLDAGKYQLAEALLEQDFNKASRKIQWNSKYQKYLFKAAAKGHHHIIPWLCDMGADINATGFWNKPALFYAIKERHYFAQMACLEARGFDLRALDSGGNTILMLAARNEPTAVAPILDFIMTHAERLGISNEDIRNFILQVDNYGENALMLATHYQPTAVAPILDFITTHAERLGDDVIRKFILQVGKIGYNALLHAAEYQPTAVAPILDFITTHAEHLGISNEGIRNFILQVRKNGYNALLVAARYKPTAVAPILDFIMTHAERLGSNEDIRNFILQVDNYGGNALMLATHYQPTAVAPILDFIITHAAIFNDEQLAKVFNSKKIKIQMCNILKQKLNSLITTPDIENTFDGLPLIVRLAKASIGRDALHQIYIGAVTENCADNPERARELLEYALQTNNAIGCFFANHRGLGLFARGDTRSQSVLRIALERIPVEPTALAPIPRSGS